MYKSSKEISRFLKVHIYQIRRRTGLMPISVSKLEIRSASFAKKFSLDLLSVNKYEKYANFLISYENC